MESIVQSLGHFSKCPLLVLQLFNTVSLVNEVILQPRQIQQVILTFRASGPSKDALDRAREFGGQPDVQRSSNQVGSNSASLL